MKFAYIDGDDIGLKIEKSFMDNDEDNLKRINDDVKLTIKKITQYLIKKNYKIIFSGADGIICKGADIQIDSILNFIRTLNGDLKFSIGAGNCLRDSYLALRYAKSNGKNIGAIFDNGFKLVQ